MAYMAEVYPKCSPAQASMGGSIVISRPRYNTQYSAAEYGHMVYLDTFPNSVNLDPGIGSGQTPSYTQWANAGDHTKTFGFSVLGGFQWNSNIFPSFYRGANVSYVTTNRVGNPGNLGPTDGDPAVDPFYALDYNMKYTVRLSLLDAGGAELKWCQFIALEHYYLDVQYPPYYPWNPGMGYSMPQWSPSGNSNFKVTDTLTFDALAPAPTFNAVKATMTDNGTTFPVQYAAPTKYYNPWPINYGSPSGNANPANPTGGWVNAISCLCYLNFFLQAPVEIG